MSHSGNRLRYVTGPHMWGSMVSPSASGSEFFNSGNFFNIKAICVLIKQLLRTGFRTSLDWVQVPTPPLTMQMNMGMLLNFSKLQFSNLDVEYYNDIN